MRHRRVTPIHLLRSASPPLKSTDFASYLDDPIETLAHRSQHQVYKSKRRLEVLVRFHAEAKAPQFNRAAIFVAWQSVRRSARAR
jgi:hypothetical protein